MPVWVYLRKSRAEAQEEAAGGGDALQWHRATLERLLEADGVLVPPECWIEEIGSGGTIAARPRFRELLEVWRRLPARAGGVVYCVDADRLSRGVLKERGEVQELLVRARLRIRTPAGYTDLWDTDQRLLHDVKGALGQWELGKYKDRVARTLQEQRLQGIPGGSLPFGYYWDRNERPKQVKAHPEQFPILQALCREAFHYSTCELARRHGLQQHKVYRLLVNPFIAGYPARRHFGQEGERLRLRDGQPRANQSALAAPEEWQWPQQPGNWPAAISLAEWQELQVALKRRGTTRLKPMAPDGWCRDVVRFAGQPDITRVCLSSNISGRPGGGQRRLTYEGRVGDRVVATIGREPVHHAAGAAVRKLFTDPSVVRLGLQLYREVSAAATGQGDFDAGRLERDLAAKQARLADLWVTAPDDPLDAAAIASAKERLKVEIRKTEKALLDARAVQEPDPQLDRAVPLLEHLVTDFEAIWAGLTDTERKQIIDGTIIAIHVDASKIKRGRGQVDPYAAAFRIEYRLSLRRIRGISRATRSRAS